MWNTIRLLPIIPVTVNYNGNGYRYYLPGYMVSAVLVMLMTPGVGLLLWRTGAEEEFHLDDCPVVHRLVAGEHPVDLYRYSLAFGPDVGGFIGNLQYLGLAGGGC